MKVAPCPILLNAQTKSGIVVTLSGPGGTGKTRLCLEVAGCMIDEFADGVYFVPLSAVLNRGRRQTRVVR